MLTERTDKMLADLDREKKSTDYEVIKEHLLYLVVCSALPQEELERRVGMRPSGTTGGWRLADDPLPSGDPVRVPCADRPGCWHTVFSC